MTDTPTPEAVETITDPIDRLMDHARQAQVLHHTWFKVRVDDLTGLLARALPAPRRYTGGPLEDGLYLWRFEHSLSARWDSEMVGPDFGRDFGRTWWMNHPDPPPVWIIGPIHIPEIPSEDASP